ncbi:MAG TPA: L-seryl-tRNA(Sec) selenium transferase [Anaerolineae bacterium]|nr:L-seryl-tRNA(Sec) selenium transferase [Anaerolineae bacterium]
MSKNKYLRQLPKVDEVLDLPEVKQLSAAYPRPLIVDGIRQVIDERRGAILSTPDEDVGSIELSVSSLVSDLEEWLKKHYTPSLKRVVNATGVVIHTNLGRAILSTSAIEAVANAASHYSNLEFDLEVGARGSRHSHIESLLVKITGAEAGMVVNNNASAVFLALSTLAHGKEAVVSRGQLVEIGGSFRIPDVMRQSGAILREVGTTNKTYISDYRAAITEETALLMKVHPSNFRIVGFTHEPTLEEMVGLSREVGIPIMEDLGSGVLIDLSLYGIPYEPTVQESVRAGVDVITFSGDKLLGGPQAGLVVGRTEFINRMKKHPLARAVRVDKMTLAALEATLREYLDMESVRRKNPTIRMLLAPAAELTSRAESLAGMLAKGLGDDFTVTTEPEVSRVGGGSLPLAELPTTVVSVRSAFASANAVEEALRFNEPPIIVRIKEDAVLLDPRTVQEGEEQEILSAFEGVKNRIKRYV